MGKKTNEKKPETSSVLIPIAYSVLIVAGALGVLLLSSFILPQFGLPPHDSGFPGMPPDKMGTQGFGDYIQIRFLLSAINVVLVIYLIYIYVKDYLRLKTNFTLGIIAFLFSFLLYAIATLPVLHLFLGDISRSAFISFVPMLFSALGLILFVRLSNV
ncbi:hypothetical protein KJ780_02825 [Candidatus Micrarchaeota archaeon]|nr:hypothetical protein [Candidatus Micrarchaeota archaeon]